MLHDLRHAARVLAKSPAFAAVAVLSLGLGICAHTAIYSLLNALLIRPIPVENPERMVSVFMTNQRNPGNLPLSHLNYKQGSEFKVQGSPTDDCRLTIAD
jgi:hypothetical protein